MVYRQRKGQQKPVERPDRVAPEVEKHEGTNIPWRGTETHGVPIPDDTVYDTLEADRPWVDDEPDIPYLPPEDETEPVAVRVVTDSRRERLTWRALRFRANDQAQQVLGRHEKRRNCRIKVHYQTDGVDSFPVWIGSDDGVKPYTGYQVDRGETLMPLVSTEPIYVICNPNEEVELSVLYEFAVEL